MNRYYKLLLLLIFTFSCTNENINEPELTQELILKQVNAVFFNTPTECGGQFTDFDSQGKILEVYSTCNGESNTQRTYTYTDNGLIKSIVEGFGAEVFLYENNVLVGHGGGSDASIGNYTEFTYYGNKMIANYYQSGEISNNYSIFEFEDDTYAKLISIKGYDNSSGIDELTYLKTFQYEGKNPVEIYIESKNGGGSERVPFRRITLTYDDKINPYKKGFTEHAYLKEHTRIIGFVDHNMAYSADNNIASMVFEDLVQNTSYAQTYTYQYNGDMYPTEAMNFVNGDYRSTDYFEYY